MAQYDTCTTCAVYELDLYETDLSVSIVNINFVATIQKAIDCVEAMTSKRAYAIAS